MCVCPESVLVVISGATEVGASTLAANSAISRQGFLYNIMVHTPAYIQRFSRRLHGASDDLDEGGSVCYHFFATFDRLTQCPVRLNRNKRDTSVNTRSTELATASISLIAPRSRTRGAQQRAMRVALRRHENS